MSSSRGYHRSSDRQAATRIASPSFPAAFFSSLTVSPSRLHHTAASDADSNISNGDSDDDTKPLIAVSFAATATTTPTLTRTPTFSAFAHSSAASSSSSHAGLSSWTLLSLCVPVIPSQLGWAVGEALLIPYLMSLGLEETTANAIWLINPLVGFFVQPYIGAWSDGYKGPWGRRRPFLFAFHIGIVAGLLMIGFAPELHQLLLPSFEPFDQLSQSANVTLLTIIFTGCVLMELSNDLLTIPSRALLNDSLPEQQIEQGNAW